MEQARLFVGLASGCLLRLDHRSSLWLKRWATGEQGWSMQQHGVYCNPVKRQELRGRLDDSRNGRLESSKTAVNTRVHGSNSYTVQC